MHSAKVSCIIATYNTKENILIEAVKSILNQTYRNFELIIIDDGSEIPIVKTLNSIKDNRLKIITNPRNLGVTYSRNIGIEHMTGKYMAVMDADDVSLPVRFERQVDFLERHRRFSLVSCQMAFIADDQRNNPFIKIPNVNAKYQVWLFWDNARPFPHGPAMIRKEFLDNHHIKYNEKYKKAMDYRLWVDCAQHGRFKILKDYLYLYRVHNQQISKAGSRIQAAFADMICVDQLINIGLDPTEDEKNVHLALRDSDAYISPENTYLWVKKVIKANKETNYYKNRYFANELKYRFFKMCYKNYILKRDMEYRGFFLASINIVVIFRSISARIVLLLNKEKPNNLRV